MDQKDNQKDNTTMGPVADRYGYIAAKNHKLASALYLITNFLNDSEPIKWKLRNQALDLAGQFSLGRSAAVFYKLSVFDRALKLMDEIITLLDIARTIGGVSEMNLTVLKQEYENLKGQLEELAGSRGLENYLYVPDLPKLETRPQESAALSHTAQPARAPDREPPKESKVAPVRRVENYESNKPSEPKNGRKQVIISFLASRDWTSIKDIASAVPDCSQKTVQRELSDLVEQGVLKKRGDRRWSRYVLVK